MAWGGAKATTNWASIFRVGMKATSLLHPCFPTVLQPGNQHPFWNINFASIFPGKMDVKWMLGGGSENAGTSNLRSSYLGKRMQNGCWVGVRKWTSIGHPCSDSPNNGCPILRPFCIRGGGQEEVYIRTLWSRLTSQASHRRQLSAVCGLMPPEKMAA